MQWALLSIGFLLQFSAGGDRAGLLNDPSEPKDNTDIYFPVFTVVKIYIVGFWFPQSEVFYLNVNISE
jgi:hypothetical protein